MYKTSVQHHSFHVWLQHMGIIFVIIDCVCQNLFLKHFIKSSQMQEGIFAQVCQAESWGLGCDRLQVTQSHWDTWQHNANPMSCPGCVQGDSLFWETVPSRRANGWPDITLIKWRLKTLQDQLTGPRKGTGEVVKNIYWVPGVSFRNKVSWSFESKGPCSGRKEPRWQEAFKLMDVNKCSLPCLNSGNQIAWRANARNQVSRD